MRPPLPATGGVISVEIRGLSDFQMKLQLFLALMYIKWFCFFKLAVADYTALGQFLNHWHRLNHDLCSAIICSQNRLGKTRGPDSSFKLGDPAD